MANINVITGAKQIIANLRKRDKALAAGAARGIRKAGLRLQRESQRLVPVDFGVLKASAFTRVTGKGYKTQANVGYTAAYAIFVHEAVEMKLKGEPRRPPSRGRYWDPQGRAQPKFLEEPARRLRPELRKIIREETKIK